jgi:alkylation response protein AidB-like acyl-CoA dehydrogenase
MDFVISEEHQMMRTAVKQMLAKHEHRKREWREMTHRDHKFNYELWAEFASLGLLGCLVPEEYGGNNTGLVALTLAFEDITALGFSPSLMLVTCMDTACILKNGSDEMKRRIIPDVVAGTKILVFAVTEPNAGSNTFRTETLARKHGDRYVMNGQKIFITGVEVADYMLVVARTTTLEECQQQGKPKSHGLSLFLVDPKTPGLTKTPIPTVATEGVYQWQLFFDNVEIPAENLVGVEDQGVLAMFNSLNPERILVGAICCGMAEQAITMAVNYAKGRRVFKDTPIGAYQGVAHPLAEAKIMLEAAKLMTYRAAWAFDQGMNPAIVGSYANQAKLLAADVALKAVDASLETHGGMGFAEETGLSQLWNGARVLKTAPLNREMILNYVAEQELGLPRSY